jgi:hypothetical protein
MKTNIYSAVQRLALIGISGALLTLGGLFFGCATPAFPKPGSADATLVVVPYLIFNTRAASQPMVFSYQINLENVATNKMKSFFIKSSDVADYLYLSGFPEGKYIVKEYMTQGFVGSPTKALDVQKYLTVEKGKVSLLPIKIIITMVDSKDPQYSGSVYFDYKELDDKQEARIFKQLGAKEGFSLWRK